jgi:glutamate decarboxylase
MYISTKVARMGPFELLSDGSDLPVFGFALKDNSRYTVFDLSDKLRERGWQVSAYTMPPEAEDIAVLRVMVREGFSRDLADMFVEDLQRAVDHFAGGPAATKKKSKVFSH